MPPTSRRDNAVAWPEAVPPAGCGAEGAPPCTVEGVRLNKSTRYALYAATEMAAARDRVTVGAVAKRYRIPLGALAKVFQQLVRAGIATGTRGIGGGYRLARSPRDLTMLDVVQVYEPTRNGTSECPVNGSTPEDCAVFPTCRLRHIFDEVDEMVRCTFASVSLETLVGGPRPLAPAGPAKSESRPARRRVVARARRRSR